MTNIEVLAEISNVLNDTQHLDYPTDIEECDLINSNSIIDQYKMIKD